MATTVLTIGRLARAAGVGVETIRYYQRRGLLPVPGAGRGAFREYPPALADRIRFIRRSQDLGFTLGEIAELLRLEEGGERHEVRAIAQSRLHSIKSRIDDLQRMETTLSRLLRECEHNAAAAPCPIIAALRFDAPDAHA